MRLSEKDEAVGRSYCGLLTLQLAPRRELTDDELGPRPSESDLFSPLIYNSPYITVAIVKSKQYMP